MMAEKRRPREEAASAWRHRHLLDLESLSEGEIRTILRVAKGYGEAATARARSAPALAGRTVVNLFWEPSTRTRISFRLAARRLSAEVVDFAAESSSARKGESLLDTARTIIAMGVDALVVRHPTAGAPHSLAEGVGEAVSVINAGDGAHAHPTQGLLDLHTILERLCREDLEGLRVGIVGDIAHSRVARSDICAFRKFGADLVLAGPQALVPESFRERGLEIRHSLDEVLPELDVLCLLRIQRERLDEELLPSLEEYARHFCMSAGRLKRAREDLLILHPGPMNRGIEIDPEVADGPHSLILTQVTHGLAVRMAVLTLTLGGERSS
ncbi:MAG: aspartate carbamoyltransferase catalytic subunit [Planctomycetota bacterium]